MTSLFISDLHLHPSRPAIITGFVRFLQQQQGRVEKIYILGDLFEAWIGDDQPDPAYRQVEAALSECSKAGTPLFLMHGNRDFLIGDRFVQQTGCSLLADPTTIDLYGTSTLLMHGDSLCTDDHEYQAFRKQVRDPDWQQRVLCLPVEQRLELADQARRHSTLAVQDKDEYIMDVNQDEVLRVITEHGVDQLIHGHTHRRAIHLIDTDHGQVTRIVLGDWYETGSALAVDEQGFRFESIACS